MADTVLPTGKTREIPRAEWKAYFERFTKQHLTNDPPKDVTVEVLSLRIGDQFEARTERLLGLTYDPKSDALEALLEDVEHLVFNPVAIWVIETDEGFISTMELVHADDTREILYIYRGGPPAPIYQGTFP
jgi:hypothetical protein